MTKRTIGALLVILTCVTAYGGAQARPRDSLAEATVSALDNQERLAALNQDFAALERLWSEHFIVNAPSNQILPNRGAVLDWFRKGMTTRSSYARSIEQVRVDGDIAIVMGVETLTPTANAPNAGQTVRRRFTNIWRKEGDTWRLWARHANVIPEPAITPEQAVLATDDRRTEALRRGSAGPLREIYADDYTLVTPAGVIRSKADQISEVESGQLRYGAIEVLDRTVRIYDDVAVVVSRDKYDILLRGRQVGGDIRFTRVYKRFGAPWRLIATHGSPVAK